MRRYKTILLTIILFNVIFSTMAMNAAAEDDYNCPVCGVDVDYGQPKCLYCGTILEWDEEIEAMVDIDPDTINLKSNGKWITAYIELPPGYDVTDIDLSTVTLKVTLFEVGGEYGEFQTTCAVVKFDRQLVEGVLYGQGETATFTVTGSLTSGITFFGMDTCAVLNDDEEEKTNGKCPATFEEERPTNQMHWVYIPNSGGVDPDYGPYVKIIWKYKEQRKYDIYTWHCTYDEGHSGPHHWHHGTKTGSVWKDTGNEKTYSQIYRSLPSWATQDGIEEKGEQLAHKVK